MQEWIRSRVFSTLKDYVLCQLKNKNGINHASPLIEDSLLLMQRIDPYREVLAKMTMEYLAIQGRRQELVEFFNDYKKLLWEDMGLKPVESVEESYNKHIQMW